MRYKRTMIAVGGFIVLTALAWVGSSAAYGQSTISRGPEPLANSAGTLTQVGQGWTISGGDTFDVSNTNDPDLNPYQAPSSNVFKYAPDSVQVISDSGTVTDQIWHMDHTQGPSGPIYSNNGYLEILPQYLSNWESALDSDANILNYLASTPNASGYGNSGVTSGYTTTWQDENKGSANSGQPFISDNLATLVDYSGDAFAPGDSGTSGAPGSGVIWVANSPVAKVTFSGGYTSATVTQGQPVDFYDSAGIQAYNSDYHFEYITLTGPGGQDDTSDFSETSLQGQAPYQNDIGLMTIGGSQMIEIDGGGLASGTQPTSSNYVTTVNGGATAPNVINTTNLSPGTYTITLDVTDWYGRTGTATASFTVKPVNGINVTLTANPSTPPNLPLGESTILTAKEVGIPPSDNYTLTIVDKGADTTLADGTMSTYSGAASTSPVATSAVSQVALTDTYIAHAFDSTTGKTYDSAPVSITWGSTTPPTSQCFVLTVSSQTSNSGGSTNSANLDISGGTPGDVVTLTATNGSFLIGGSNAATDTVTLNSSGDQQVTVDSGSGSTTTVNAEDAGGCSGSTTITWTGNGGSEGPSGLDGVFMAGVQSEANPEEMDQTLSLGQSAKVDLQAILVADASNTIYTSYQSNPAGSPTTFGGDYFTVTSNGSGADAYSGTLNNPPDGNNLDGTVVSNVPTTVTYTATMYSASGQELTSASQTLTWIGLTTSANPTILPVNSPSTITVSGVSGGSWDLVSSANVIPGETQEQSCTSGKHGSTCVPLQLWEIPGNSLPETFQATSTVAQSVQFYATYLNPTAYDPQYDPPLQSNSVYVAWGASTSCTAPDVSITMHLSGITSGAALGSKLSGTLTVNGTPGDTIDLSITDGTFNGYMASGGSTSTVVLNSSGEGTEQVFQDEGGDPTSTVTADDTTNPACSPTAPTVLHWTNQASVTLAANPQTPPDLGLNASSTLTATISDWTSSDTYSVQINDLGSDDTLNGGNTADSLVSDQSPFSTTAASATPVTDTYQAVVTDNTTGEQITSNVVSLTWSAESCSVLVSAGTPSNGTVTVNVTDPNDDTLDLSVTNGTLSESTVSSGISLTLTQGSGNPSSSVISTTDVTNSSCAIPSVTVTWASECSVTLSAGVPNGDQAVININDPNGDSISLGAQQGSLSEYSVTSSTSLILTQGSGNPSSSVVNATDNTNSACTIPSVTVNWVPVSPPPPPPGTCPAPYDSNYSWVDLGNGNQELEWTYNVPTPVYSQENVCTTDASGNVTCAIETVQTGCTNDTVPESQVYTSTLNSGAISGLSYDPGVPGAMWLPEATNAESNSGSEYNWGGQQTSGSNGSYVPTNSKVQMWTNTQGPGTFWGALDLNHGWDGNETGGPSASQISGTFNINGMQFHTYGPGEGTMPWAYARPASGFGIRMIWTGSPNAAPTGGVIKYTMVNPDYESRTWAEPLVLNGSTLVNEGAAMAGINQPPTMASEAVSAWTNIPKHVLSAGGVPELAAWSLSANPYVVAENGAQINVTITLNTPAGTITDEEQDVIQIFSFPAWYGTHLIAYQNQGN